MGQVAGIVLAERIARVAYAQQSRAGIPRSADGYAGTPVELASGTGESCYGWAA